MHICPKGGCPNRISFGNANDTDSVNFVCVKCDRLYQSSDSKEQKAVIWFKRFGLVLSGVLILLFLFKIDLLNVIFPSKSSAEPQELTKDSESSNGDGLRPNKPEEKDARGDKPDPVRTDITITPDNIVVNKKSSGSIDKPGKNTDSPPKSNEQHIDIKHQQWYRDSDADGFGNPNNMKSSIKKPGPNYRDTGGDCDDGNPNVYPGRTEICNNKIDDNCNGKIDEGCISTQKQKFYSDIDGDKLGDPNNSKEYVKGEHPFSYIENALDECPSRPGIKANKGCPQFQAELVSSDATIIKSIDIAITGDSLLTSDVVTWSGPPEIIFDQKSGEAVSFRSDIVGSYTLRYNVVGTDGFSSSGKSIVEIGMTNNQLKKKLKPLLKYGMLGQNSSGSFLASANAAKEDIFRHLSKDNIMVYDEVGLDINPFDTFMSADLMGSGGNILDVDIVDISYDNSTHKIDRIELKVLRK